MPIRMLTTQIGGAKWEMNSLPATTGLACLTQLASIVGAPAGAAAGGLKQGSGGLMGLDAGLMGEAVSKMTQRLAEPQTVELIKTLLTDLRRNDKRIEFEDYFAANYGELAQLIGWSIKENFGSFLAGSTWLGSLAGRVQKSMSEASTGESSG